ncbi:MAG: hypothetical protein JSW27_10625 [Phycisphaerales bacterium]|nr:MAG: hypothetical protein JSW27_10625 [Phycisphaerales bacterium]
MTRKSIPGLQVLETPTADADMSQQVHEIAPDTPPTDPSGGAQDPVMSEPRVTVPPQRRRLGSEEPLPAAPARSGASEPALDVERAQRAIIGLRSEQCFSMGLVGGAIAAAVGAILWATVTIATGYQIGYMAVGIGALVGGAVRVLGKGITKPFGYVGAALSFVGCLAGNLLSVCAIIAQQEELAFSYVLTHLNPAAIPELMVAAFHPMDLLFYGLALYAGYRFAFRRVTMADVMRIAPTETPGSAPPPVA